MHHPTFLLYGHGGYGNRGCEAIVRSTSSLVSGICRDAQIILCSERPKEDRALAMPTIERVVAHGVSPFSPERIVNAFASRLGGSRDAIIARTQAPMLRAARHADVCLSIGGDTYCYKPPEMLYAINRRLRAKGKNFVLWGCSVDPERLEGEVLADLRHYDALYARESITYQAMLDAGLSPTQSADSAFAMLCEYLPFPDGFVEGKTMGLNISPLAFSHTEDGDRAFEACEALIRHILRTTDLSVALTPHVRWAHDDDLPLLSALHARFPGEPRVLMLDPTLTAPQLKGYIARMRCFIGARTHATIAAYSTYVPTLALGYSIKARGIARDLFGDETGYLLPVQELCSERELTTAFDALVAGAQAQRKLLLEAVPQQISSVCSAVQRVVDCARKCA